MQRTITSKAITFKNSENLSISAVLDTPGQREPTVYAIFSHCFTCSKHFKAAAYISRALVAFGYGVMRFDFAGIGDSEGLFKETTFSTNVSDIIAGARYMAERKMAPGLLIGHSFGGTATLRAAGDIPSAKAVVTIGSPADPGHILRLVEHQKREIETRGEARIRIGDKPVTIGRQFLEDVSNSRVSDSVRKLNKALLVLHSPFDAIVGIENAAAIFRAARHPKSFVSLAGADHLLTESEDAEYAARLIAVWAGRYLGAESIMNEKSGMEAG